MILPSFISYGHKIANKEINSSLSEKKSIKTNSLTLFMCGDVMIGRGIDQILPNPSDPVLHEPYIKNANDYVELAEEKNGFIEKPVNFSYVWGDALEIFEHLEPDVKIINLETSVTKSNDNWKGKRINYRMNPDNISVLTTAGVDYASLSNNHLLDWGYSGLKETIETLNKARIENSGAGLNTTQASKPAVIELESKKRVVALSVGSYDSGIPFDWEATHDRPGVNLITHFSDEEVKGIKSQIDKVKKPEDVIVVSVHWGSNWGYGIPYKHRKFAQKLIDDAGVDIIHGHSSHHVKGIEIYRGKPIIYGAGDFINDYEGISGYESFRDDLSLMYFVSIDFESKQLTQLKMVPMQIKKFRLNRASYEDSKWLEETLKREGDKLGTGVEMDNKGILHLKW